MRFRLTAVWLFVSLIGVSSAQNRWCVCVCGVCGGGESAHVEQMPAD